VKKRFYVDENRKATAPDNAVGHWEAEYDDQGKLIKETWYKAKREPKMR
jgi:YD repeat-containing protein